MVGPPMPGENPAHHQMRQQRQRQMQYAWWKEQQQQAVAAPVANRRGLFVRLILGLISLALLIVMFGALFGAGWALRDEAPELVALGLGVAVVAGILRRGVRHLAKGR